MLLVEPLQTWLRTTVSDIPVLPWLTPCRDSRSRRLLLLALTSDLPVLTTLRRHGVLPDDESVLCPLCELEPETQLHLLQTCDALQTLPGLKLPDLPALSQELLNPDQLCRRTSRTGNSPGPSRNDQLPLLLAQCAFNFLAGGNREDNRLASVAAKMLTLIWFERCARLARRRVQQRAADTLVPPDVGILDYHSSDSELDEQMEPDDAPDRDSAAWSVLRPTTAPTTRDAVHADMEGHSPPVYDDDSEPCGGADIDSLLRNAQFLFSDNAVQPPVETAVQPPTEAADGRRPGSHSDGRRAPIDVDAFLTNLIRNAPFYVGPPPGPPPDPG